MNKTSELSPYMGCTVRLSPLKNTSMYRVANEIEIVSVKSGSDDNESLSTKNDAESILIASDDENLARGKGKIGNIKDEKDEDFIPSASESDDEDFEYRKKRIIKNLDKSRKSCDSDSQSESEEDRKKSKKKQNNHLSEYERMLIKNKEDKLHFLNRLKINELKDSLKEAVRANKPKHEKRIKKPKSSSPPPPVRRSVRTTKCNDNLSESALSSRAMMDVIDESESEEEYKNKVIRPKRQTRERSYTYRHVLSIGPRRKCVRMAKVMEDMSEEALLSRAFKENLTTQVQPPVLKFEDAVESVTKPYFLDDIGVPDRKKIKPLKNGYAAHFERMKFCTDNIARLHGSKTMALAFHPLQRKILLAAGSSTGSISLWNVNSKFAPCEFKPHLYSITNLQFNSEKINLVVSSSDDGTLRCGDFERSIFQVVFNVSAETSCTDFNFLSPTSYLIARKDGYISVVDDRSESKTCTMKHKCHDFPIGSVSVHPMNKSYFITTEQQSALRLWDLRKLQQLPVIGVYKRDIVKACFSPVTGNSILITTNEDTICIYDSSNLQWNIQFMREMTHINYMGANIPSFRATWMPNTDDMFVVGSTQIPKRIEIFSDKMENIFNFMEESMNSYSFFQTFHPSLPVLASANNGGKVYIFRK